MTKKRMFRLQDTTIVSFVPHDAYLIYASISKEWLCAWRLSKRAAISDSRHFVASVALTELAMEAGVSEDDLMWDAIAASGLDVVSFLYDKFPHRFVTYTVSHATRSGRLDVFQFLCQKTGEVMSSYAREAARAGCFDIVKWMHEQGYIAQKDVISNLMRDASVSGNMALLQWLYHAGYGFSPKVRVNAAANGHLEVLKWAIGIGRMLEMECMHAAAGVGHLHIIEWAHENGCSMDAVTIAEAASNGHGHIVKWLHEYDCPYDNSVCTGLARSGCLETLKWVRARGYPWDSSASTAAAEGGRMKTLRWMLDNGCSYDWALVLFKAVLHGDLDLVQYLIARGAALEETAFGLAATLGHMHIVQWARDSGYEMPATLCNDALRGDRHDLLQWLLQNGYTFVGDPMSSLDDASFETIKLLHENGCPWHPNAYITSVLSRDMENLEWIYERGCPLSGDLFYDAASTGDLRIMQWLYDRGCPWSTEAYYVAIAGAHIHVVVWLRDHGCPFDESACAAAASAGNFYMLRWLHDNGFPWDSSTIKRAYCSEYWNMLNWAIERGCPVCQITVHKCLDNTPPDELLRHKKKYGLLLEQLDYGLADMFGDDEDY